MTRKEALSRLKGHEAELRRFGLHALFLFGSTLRDEAKPSSDVDLLCDFRDSDDLGLLEFIRVRDRLSDLLESPIDLVERRSMRPRILKRVEHEMLQVF